MNLTIGLVATCLNTAHIRGMGRYVYELLRQSAPYRDINWRLYGNNPECPLIVPPGAHAEPDLFSFRGDRFYLWEQLGLPLRTRAHPVNVLHCTEGSLPWWQPQPTVVTLHDTIAWSENDGSAITKFYFGRVLPAALAKCAAIITDSESSSRDILKMWPALAPKLTVIPMGIGDEYFTDEDVLLPEELRGQLGTNPYVVYMGGPIKRKRFDWALQVLAAAGRPDLHLIACGFGQPMRDQAAHALPDALRGRIHFPPFLTDAELRALYRGAEAVLYPTLYEGFGFPAVEAQAAGVPVVFSALGSLAELIGPLAFVVEPHDLEAWVGALQRARALGERRAGLAHEARAWAQRFSWQQNFEKHLEIYWLVAGDRRT